MTDKCCNIILLASVILKDQKVLLYLSLLLLFNSNNL